MTASWFPSSIKPHKSKTATHPCLSPSELVHKTLSAPGEMRQRPQVKNKTDNRPGTRWWKKINKRLKISREKKLNVGLDNRTQVKMTTYLQGLLNQPGQRRKSTHVAQHWELCTPPEATCVRDHARERCPPRGQRESPGHMRGFPATRFIGPGTEATVCPLQASNCGSLWRENDSCQKFWPKARQGSAHL
jgi:hypothetical protein